MYGEHNQSGILDEVLGGQSDGFYVECGAGNGLKTSNSMFFETKRNWTGLLIEPNPVQYEALRKLKRYHV